MEVNAPDGRVWTVHRQPGRKPRKRGGNVDVLDIAEIGTLGDGVAGFVAGIVLAIVIALVIVVVLPLVLFVGEALLIGIGLVLLAGPWRVEATTQGPPSGFKVWKVRGLWKSRRAVREVADELRHGVDAAPEGMTP